ncbi:MAG: 6-bladed beta-propeller [Candidatus Delongbacteria bacterium]
MKSMKVWLFVIAAGTLLLSGCTKKEATYAVSEVNGIRITQNTGVPADSTYKVVPKELYTIKNDDENPDNCFRQASSVDLDESGNLYVFDRKSFKVFKYDPAGKLLKVFGGQGQGPGEFIQPGTINVRKDTLYVTEIRSYKISKFNLDGEFIEDKKYPDIQNFPIAPAKFGENYITFGATKNTVTDEGKEIRSYETSLYDHNFDFIKNLHIIEFEPPAEGVEYDPSEKGIKAAASDINAYVYEHSKTQYKIDVYEINGNKVREIWKRHARVRRPEEEQIKNVETWAKWDIKYKSEFINSIYQLRTDKYNRLWVSGPTNKEEEGFYYDIFENDIFINRIMLDIDEGYSLNFVGDKIVGVNYSENKIKIYEY